MRTTTTAAVAVAVALALTGCGEQAQVGTSEGVATAGTNRPAETPEPTETEETQAPTEEPEPEPVEDEVDAPGATVFDFGQTKTYRLATSEDTVTAEDEPLVSVTVEAPQDYDYEYPEDYPGDVEFVSFDVTVVNVGQDPYDPNEFYSTVQSANREAEQLYDAGLDTPTTTLLPGREAQFTIGYAVADPEDIVMELQPGFDYGPVIFTNTQN